MTIAPRQIARGRIRHNVNTPISRGRYCFGRNWRHYAAVYIMHYQRCPVTSRSPGMRCVSFWCDWAVALSVDCAFDGIDECVILGYWFDWLIDWGGWIFQVCSIFLLNRVTTLEVHHMSAVSFIKTQKSRFLKMTIFLKGGRLRFSGRRLTTGTGLPLVSLS